MYYENNNRIKCDLWLDKIIGCKAHTNTQKLGEMEA